jgi:hypothetical protein
MYAGPLGFSFVKWSVELQVPYVGKTLKNVEIQKAVPAAVSGTFDYPWAFYVCNGQDSKESARIDSHQDLFLYFIVPENSNKKDCFGRVHCYRRRLVKLGSRRKAIQAPERSGVPENLAMQRLKLWDPRGVDVGLIDEKERWQLIDTASGEL